MKQWQSLIIGIIVSVVMLAYALRGVQLETIGPVLSQGRYVFVLPTLVFMFAALWFRALRWRALLDKRIGVGHSFNILNVSYLFNSVLPLRLGEVVRSFLATRLNPPIAVFTALSTVVVEQLTNVLAVVVVVMIAVFITPVAGADTAGARQTIETGTLISAVVAILGTALLILMAARRSLAHNLLNGVLRALPFLERLNLRRLLDHTLDGIAPLTSPRTAGAVFLWTVLGWIASVVQTYLLLYVFYPQPNWTGTLLSTAVVSLAVAIPAVPGNVGPFEAASVFGLAAGGMAATGDPAQQTRALAFAVLLHLLSIVLFAFLGVIGLSQERISLGEVMRAARQFTSRSKPNNISTEALTEPVSEKPVAQPVQPEG